MVCTGSALSEKGPWEHPRHPKASKKGQMLCLGPLERLSWTCSEGQAQRCPQTPWLRKPAGRAGHLCLRQTPAPERSLKEVAPITLLHSLDGYPLGPKQASLLLGYLDGSVWRFLRGSRTFFCEFACHHSPVFIVGSKALKERTQGWSLTLSSPLCLFINKDTSN